MTFPARVTITGTYINTDGDSPVPSYGTVTFQATDQMAIPPYLVSPNLVTGILDENGTFTVSVTAIDCEGCLTVGIYYTVIETIDGILHSPFKLSPSITDTDGIDLSTIAREPIR